MSMQQRWLAFVFVSERGNGEAGLFVTTANYIRGYHYETFMGVINLKTGEQTWV